MTKEPSFIVALGAEASKPDIRDYRIDTSEKIKFPKEFQLPMPAVKNQGSVGSCVAHALATLIEFFNDQENEDEAAMSVGFIYGNRAVTNTTKSGMVTRHAISTICSDGDVYNSDFPFNEEVPKIFELIEPKLEELREKAKPYAFKTYFAVKTEEEIKTALMKNGPVVIAVDWQKDMRVRDGVITSTFKEKTGGHCMVLYGWNEQGWLIQNSWGKFWGNGGRAIWPYKYKIREAYSVIDKANENAIKVKKPFKTNTKVGKFIVRAINFVYATIYGWYYKIKYID